MLEELFTKYGTDKGIWGYTPAYVKHLEPLRVSIRNVLEIGICGYRDIPNNVVGASLFAWRDYFPLAVINGIDNDSRFIFNDISRIRTALADAYDPIQLRSVLANWGNPQYQFICDDAVHDPVTQMHLVSVLWEHLAPGGIYAIEEACPYKVPNGELDKYMILPLMEAFSDMTAIEYETEKPERLIILKKAP